MNNFRSARIAIGAAVVISLAGSTINMLRYTITDAGEVSVPTTCMADDAPYAHNYAPNQTVRNYQFDRPSWWSCELDLINFWCLGEQAGCRRASMNVDWHLGLITKILPCALLAVFITLLVRMLVEAHERRTRLCSTPGSAYGAHHAPNAAVASASAVASTSAGKSQAERTTAMCVTRGGGLQTNIRVASQNIFSVRLNYCCLKI